MKKVIGVIGHGCMLRAAEVLKAKNYSERTLLLVSGEIHENPWGKDVQRGIQLSAIPQVTNIQNPKSGQEQRRERRKNERKNKK